MALFDDLCAASRQIISTVSCSSCAASCCSRCLTIAIILRAWQVDIPPSCLHSSGCGFHVDSDVSQMFQSTLMGSRLSSGDEAEAFAAALEEARAGREAASETSAPRQVSGFCITVMASKKGQLPCSWDLLEQKSPDASLTIPPFWACYAVGIGKLIFLFRFPW